MEAQMFNEKLFWSYVDKSGDCWLWTGELTHLGYGKFNIYPPLAERHIRRFAHRLSYESSNGPIPDGLEIDHTCHARHCVKPGHLQPATRKQNCENRAGAQTNSKSGVRGVHWEKGRAKWRARVKSNGQYVYVAYFDDLAEADAAVSAVRAELFVTSNRRPE